MTIHNRMMKATDTAFKSLHKLFSDNGKSLWMVGGAVRDLQSGNGFPMDIDFCTDATPDEMKAMVNDNYGWKLFETGISHGTVTFMSLLGCFEITTLRKDVECNGRHASVEFTTSLKEDASRRDFTFNAMYMDIDGKIYDFFDGQTDLDNQKVKFIGNAEDRIKEDALRILRYFRFLSEYNNYDEADFDAVKANIKLLEGVSVERIWSEISKAACKNPIKMSSFFDFMILSGSMEILGIPVSKDINISRMRDIYSTRGEYPAIFPEFFMAAILPDPIATSNFCDKFKVSNTGRERMMWFSNMIDRYGHKDSKNYFGPDAVKEHMYMDGDRPEHLQAFASFYGDRFLEESINHIPRLKFPVTGQDLLDKGFTPGPHIGEKLAKMKKRWKVSDYTATKEQLINRI